MKENNQNNVIFAPMEEINNIENVIDKLITINYELKKVADAMATIKN